MDFLTFTNDCTIARNIGINRMHHDATQWTTIDCTSKIIYPYAFREFRRQFHFLIEFIWHPLSPKQVLQWNHSNMTEKTPNQTSGNKWSIWWMKMTWKKRMYGRVVIYSVGLRFWFRWRIPDLRRWESIVWVSRGRLYRAAALFCQNERDRSAFPRYTSDLVMDGAEHVASWRVDRRIQLATSWDGVWLSCWYLDRVYRELAGILDVCEVSRNKGLNIPVVLIPVVKSSVICVHICIGWL